MRFARRNRASPHSSRLSSWRTRLAGGGLELSGMRDVGLHLELHVEQLFVLSRPQFAAGAIGRRHRDVDRCDDTWQRSDVREELGYLMIRAGDGELVPIGVELIAVR